MITYTCDHCSMLIADKDTVARHVVIGLREMPDRKAVEVDFRKTYKPAEEAGRDYCGECVEAFAREGWRFQNYRDHKRLDR